MTERSREGQPGGEHETADRADSSARCEPEHAANLTLKEGNEKATQVVEIARLPPWLCGSVPPCAKRFLTEWKAAHTEARSHGATEKNGNVIPFGHCFYGLRARRRSPPSSPYQQETRHGS